MAEKKNLTFDLSGKVAVVTGGGGVLCSGFSKTLAAAGAILSHVWTDTKMPVVDNLGDEFLNYVETGMTVTLQEDGTVIVE